VTANLTIQNISLHTLFNLIEMLKIFRLISFLEGVSYLLLLFIAVPIKYLVENEAYVKMLGMPHGLLFIAYIILAIMLKYDLNWKSKIFWNVLIASIVPFGTFYIDRKYLAS
jgi:integral membrane protein